MPKSQAARLFVGKDLTEGELHPLAMGLAAIFTAQSPDKNTGNEDAAAIIPYDDDSGVLVVADGVGGLPGGAKASDLAIHAIRTALRHGMKRQEQLRTAILNGIDKANRDVTALGIGAGTTLAIAEIQGKKIRPYHIGDSQIMIIGQKGKIKLQTKSHSPVGYALEAGFLQEKEAIMHEERHLVSNLIGDLAMHIEVGSQVELAAKDTLIIASDGLFDNLHTEEIAHACRKGAPLAIIHELAEVCRRRMLSPGENEPSKPDDLTFIAYRRRVAN